jgi:methionyl-tRNA synthetase
VLAAIGSPELPTSLTALAWGGTPNDRELPEARPIFPRIDKVAYLGDAVPTAAPAVKKVKAAKPPTLQAGEEKTAMTEGAAASAQPVPAAGPKEEKALIPIDKFFETQLKVATVLAAEPVPKSSKLLKLSLDLGDETRTVVAGIAAKYAPEEIIGKQVVVVANLQPAKLMGIESQGMVLAASQDGLPILLHPAQPVPPGTRVK